MYCPKCGNAVKEGYEFCMGCGTKIESSDASAGAGVIETVAAKPRPLKKILVFSAIAVVVIALAAAAFLFLPKLIEPAMPYVTMNVSSGVQLDVDGNTIVYIGTLSSQNNFPVHIKSNFDGTDQKILLVDKEDAEFVALYLYDKKIYYCKSTNDENTINTIDLDGKNNKEILRFEPINNLGRLVVSDGYIYYLLNKNIWRANLDGSNRTEVISATVTSFCVDNGTVYFSSDGYIKKKDLSSDSIEDIYKGTASSLSVKNGMLSFFDASNRGIYKLNLKTNAVTLFPR